MTFWVAGGVALLGAGASIYNGQQQVGAAKDAAKSTQQQNAATLAQQNALTRQQLELQRPVIQTRDAALNQLNAFFGLPPVKGADTGYGAGGAGHGLVALPGITTTGVHGKQTNTGVLAQGLSDAGLFAGGNLANTLSPGAKVTGGKAGGMLYYDPSSHTIVDADGNNVANVPQSGQIAGLVSGFNNPVEIDASGQLYAIGSHGRGALGIQPLVAKPADAAGSQTAAPFDYNSVLTQPIFNFQRQQGEGVINRNLAAQGKFFSGQRGNALLNFNNQLVANRINEDYVQPRLTLAGYGASAASGAQNALAGQSTNLGNYAANYAGTQQNLANARQSGYAGIGQGIINGIGAGAGYYQQQQQNAYNNNLLSRIAPQASIQPVNNSGYQSNFGSGAHYDVYGNYIPG